MSEHDSEGTAVVLLSGGIDSATCMALACDKWDRVKPVFVRYGQQTAQLEYSMARGQTAHLQKEYPNTTVLDLDVINYSSVFGHFAEGVASTRDSFETEDGELVEDDGRSTGYVPMRNLHLLASAAGIADTRNADAIYIGVQGGDEEAYPDCREGFISATQKAIVKSMADSEYLDIRTPLLNLTKEGVIRLGNESKVAWVYTYSCYSTVEDIDEPEPCGCCPACEERIEAFNEAGIEDPYAPKED